MEAVYFLFINFIFMKFSVDLKHQIATYLVMISGFFTVCAFMLLLFVPSVQAYTMSEELGYESGQIIKYKNNYWYEADNSFLNLSGNPRSVFSVMLGVSSDNLGLLRNELEKKDQSDIEKQLSGKFLLAVEELGRLYYFNPAKSDLVEVNVGDLNGFFAKNSVKVDSFGSYLNNDWNEKLLELVNNERDKFGLAELYLDDNLSKVAYDKAKEMSEKNYFAHVSPSGLTPGQRLNLFSYPWLKMGENLAIGRTQILSPTKVFQMWMNSAGHRANILSQDYNYLGLAFYNNYWAQEFVKRGD